jgi:hypothetical protein
MRACVTVALVVLLVPAAILAQERGEQTLIRDDGGDVSSLMPPIPCDLRELAVIFEAPEGYPWLREIICYIANDQIQDPYDPNAPTTGPCTLAVWAPEDVEGVMTPGSTVYAYVSPGGYPEDEWITFTLPEAVDLRVGGTFPDNVFFAGMKWVERSNPIIYEDWDPVEPGSTWRKCPDEWERCWEFSALIRAVVTDSTGTAVEHITWGRVKSEQGTP